MNQFDQTLSEIAREHLAIPTLKTRRSDRLDFHEIPVWGIRDALAAAYNAGAQAAGNDATELPAPCEPGQPLKQQVVITLKLSLWIDAALSGSDLIALTTSRLRAVFGPEIAAMSNPIQILSLREEAELYGTEKPRLPVGFDDYEIQPCRRYIDADEPNLAFVEPCAPFEADFWTVYGHIPGEGAEAIGDFDSRAHAEEVFARITGRSYTGRRNSRKPA